MAPKRTLNEMNESNSNASNATTSDSERTLRLGDWQAMRSPASADSDPIDLEGFAPNPCNVPLPRIEPPPQFEWAWCGSWTRDVSLAEQCSSWPRDGHWRKLFTGTSSKIVNKEDVWINVAGFGQSTYRFRFKGEMVFKGEIVYLYENVTEKWHNVLIKKVGSAIIVNFEKVYNEDQTKVAVVWSYAFTGNRLWAVIYDTTARPTIKGCFDDLLSQGVRAGLWTCNQTFKLASGAHPNGRMNFEEV